MPCVAEVVNRSLKADCTDFTTYYHYSQQRPDGRVVLGASLSQPGSRVDWCKNTAVFEESMIFGMIMCHSITNNFLYRAIKYQLYQNFQWDFMLYSQSFI